MVIRRIREHVATHNWFAVAVDVGIVVLGVFLGNQVSNWNEGRSERAQALEDRQRLIADLGSNTADFDNRLIYFRAVRRHAQATLDALNQPAGNDEQFLVNAYQATQIILADPKRVTYDEVLATGRLTRLGAPRLRDKVGNFYVAMASAGPFLNNVPPFREQLRRALPSAIQTAVRKRCPERYDFLPDGTLLNSLPERCALGLDPAMVAKGVSAVRAIPNAPVELNRLIDDLDVKIEMIDPTLGQIRELRALIAAADEGN